MSESYLMGTRIQAWREVDAKNITFIVTEDCNLVCKYCYITGKNTKNKMSFETAKKAVDYILNHREDFPEGSVIWEFIGGEPFLEIELIDQICDYIKQEMFRLDHPWFNNYRFSFSSNGLLYSTPEVQNYIKKNKNNLSIGLSVDGNKTKHDLQRIKPDGSGSYDEIVKNVPLWLLQFPGNGTKATFSSADLPHLKDSVISLYELGINPIAANVVFEDGWQDGDDAIFEAQLRELADYIIENQLWDKFNCTFFADFIGSPLTEERLEGNWCGAGKMLAIDYQGKFYPCVRFVGYSLNKREGLVIGDIECGYDYDRLRPFIALDTKSQSTAECINCQVGEGCAWCQGFNYDDAKISTIYQRTTYICKMHKARVRANDYYWARLKQVAGIERENTRPRKDHLYFILSDESARHCNYQPQPKGANGEYRRMSLETLKQGLAFAQYNFYTPVLLLPPTGLTLEEKAALHGSNFVQMYNAGQPINSGDNIPVYDNNLAPAEGDLCILIVAPENIAQVSSLVTTCLANHQRVNLILEDAHTLTDETLAIYENELLKIAEYLVDQYSQGRIVDVNVISDRILFTHMNNCNAGLDSFALAPDGNFYICPAFYFKESTENVGSLEHGITFDYAEFLTLTKSPVCSKCDAYHCRRCVHDNLERTGEYLIPGQNQCVISHIERKVSRKFVEMLRAKGIACWEAQCEIPELDYYDPLDKIIKRHNLAQ